jgi:hypothetical protein
MGPAATQRNTYRQELTRGVCVEIGHNLLRWAGAGDAIKSSVTIRSDRLRQPLAPNIKDEPHRRERAADK